MLRAPRSVTRVLQFSRPILSVLLLVGGVTCRDVPTAPKLVAGDGTVASAQGGLTITPSPDTILVGENTLLTARNTNGSAITHTATWTSSDTTVATVASTGVSTGRVTGRKAGTVTITAVSQTKSGTATVRVDPVPVRSVAVTPDSASVERGDSVQYTAVPKDSAGNALTGRTIVWSVVDTLVAKTNTTGRVTTYARGTTTVRATVESIVGTAKIDARVPQLTVASISTIDSANVADTLVIAYSAQNLWDPPNADSVLVRVGVRGSNGTIQDAVRRALPRISAGATKTDTARILIAANVAAGNYTVVAFVDCKDVSGATDVARLTDCLATPATAGTIAEGDETDNARSANIVVRGPELTAANIIAPDSIFTRTTIPASVVVSNSGSATATGFDVVGGVYDVTTSGVVAGVAATTVALGSRQSRTIALPIPVPAGLNPAHTYEVRAYADCKGTGSAIERLQACYAAPATAGEITESNETNNTTGHGTIVASNVARVDAQPDSITLTAIGDTTVFAAAAYDRANAAVSGVSFAWTSLDPAIASASGATIRALATGVARIVVSSEGRVDTSRVYVIQLTASVLATPDSVTLSSVGDAVQFSAVVYDHNNNAIPGAPITWTSLDAGVSTVNAGGSAVAQATGTARIVAINSAHADTSRVFVVQQVARVTTAPDSAVVTAIGDSTHFTASAVDNNGNVVASAVIAWSSLDPAIATVSPSGSALAQSNGVARIVATASGHADTSQVLVAQLVARVVSTPESVTLGALGETSQLSAAVLDHNSHAVAGAVVTWTSLEPAVATVSGTGLVTAQTVGAARVVASSSGAADTTIVSVTQLAAHVVATPDSVLLVAIGDSAMFGATVYDNNGHPIPGASVIWSSLDPSIAAVIRPGVVSARASGVARIVANADGHSDTSKVAVVQEVANVVASPDSVTLVAIGASAQFSATAFDHNNNAVNAAISWSSLDPGVASVAGGTVVAQGVGRARIVASSGTVAATVIVNVEQRVASVTLSADTTALQQGGSVTYSATARDASGNVMTGQSFAWASSNANVASVNGAGVVSGVADGIARVNATTGGHADTATVIVNPVGYTHRWIGANSSSWTDAGNWYPGTVPDSTTNAYIPTGVGNYPDLFGANAAVGDIKLAQGATLSGGSASRLATFGNIDWYGASNVGAIDITGSGTVRGNLPPISIGASGGTGPTAVLVGRTTSPDVAVGGQKNGHLVVNGQTLVTNTLGINWGGTLGQTNATDSVIVVEDASWMSNGATNFRSDLSAGVLLIGRNLTSSGPDAAFATSGTHKVVFAGAGDHEILTNDTTGAFQNLELDGTVLFRSSSGIKGRMTLGSGAHVSMQDPNGFNLKFSSALPETELGTYDVPNTYVVGPVTQTRNHTLNSRVLVDQGGHLNLGGHTLDVLDFSTYFGTLTMSHASDTLRMRMGSSFYGREELSAGTMIVGGYLGVNPGPPVPGSAWLVSGTHKVVLDGAQAQSLSWNDTTYTHFQNLEIRNTTGVTFGSTTNVAGLLKLMPGAKAIADYNGRIKVFSQLPDVGAGTYDVAVTYVAGPITATRNETFLHGLYVDGGGSLRLGGHTLSVEGLNTYFGTFTMDAGTDTLIVRNSASFYGLTNLTAGTTIFSGFNFGATPQPQTVPGAAWNVGGTHKLVIDGTMPQTLNFADTAVDGAHDVEVRNTAGVTFSGHTSIGGLMKLVAGGKVVGDYNSTLKFRSQLPDVSQGSFEAPVAFITGNVTATRNEVFPNGFFIDGGGSLRLGGHKLDMAGISTYYGTLTMDNAADTLIARNEASFYGREDLSAGTLVVQGSYTSISYSSFVPGSAWNVSGAQKTVFAGSGPQSVYFSDTTVANFNHVGVSNPQGVTFPLGTNIHGLLQLTAGGKVSVGSYGTLRFWNQLPDISQGVYDVVATSVVGQVTATRNEIFPGNVFVESSGNLSLGGHKLDIAYFGTHDGTLTMNTAADSLIARNGAELYGAADLSAGSLILLGDLRISHMYGIPSAFHGGGSHTTVFAGTAAQNLYMPDDGLSYFGNLEVDNAAGVALNDSLDVRGQLMGAGSGVLRAQTPRVVKVSGGLNVAGLVLDGVSLDVNGGTLTRFDNVTFQTFYAPALLRIRHAGTGNVFTMNNIYFLLPPSQGSYWIDAEDTDAATGALTLDVVSAQAADGPSNTRVTNGAIVTWHAPAVGGGGGGGGGGNP